MCWCIARSLPLFIFKIYSNNLLSDLTQLCFSYQCLVWPSSWIAVSQTALRRSQTPILNRCLRKSRERASSKHKLDLSPLFLLWEPVRMFGDLMPRVSHPGLLYPCDDRWAHLTSESQEGPHLYFVGICFCSSDSFVMVVPCAVVYCIGGRIWDIIVVRLLNLEDGEPKAQRACQTSAVERSHSVLLVMRSRISVMWARERLKQIQAFCNLEVRSDCVPAPC